MRWGEGEESLSPILEDMLASMGRFWCFPEGPVVDVEGQGRGRGAGGLLLPLWRLWRGAAGARPCLVATMVVASLALLHVGVAADSMREVCAGLTDATTMLLSLSFQVGVSEESTKGVSAFDPANKKGVSPILSHRRYVFVVGSSVD